MFTNEVKHLTIRFSQRLERFDESEVWRVLRDLRINKGLSLCHPAWLSVVR